MRKYLFFAMVLVTVFSACSKKEDPFDANKQAAADEATIKDFITKNNIAATRHSSGVYYVISAPGTGTLTYNNSTNINAKYTGRLLNGQVFDSSSTGIVFALGGVIPGWQVGIPLIQKGGKIRLIIPSGLAYGNQAVGTLPANSILDFDIELVNANN